MLKILRNKKTAKKIWIILAILIVPAFVLWGSGSLIRTKGKDEPKFVGKVSNKPVSFLEFKNAVGAVRNQVIMQYGDNFSKLEKYLDIESHAWERIVLIAEAKKQRITASDKEVIDSIKTSPIFQRNGQFDKKTYQYMLRYVCGTQPRIYEEQIRQNIILSKLFKELTKGVTVNEEEIKSKYAQTNEQLSLYYILSAPMDFLKDMSASEEEIKDYFGKNRLRFKQPFSYNVEYIESESQEKIENIFQRLNQKEELNNLLKELNLTVKETGEFQETSPLPGIGWAPEVLSLLSKAQTGVYLTPVEIDKKFYLFKLKLRKEPYIPEFDTIKDKVKIALLKTKADFVAKRKIELCSEKLKKDYQAGSKAADFDKAAKLFGLKSSSTDPFKFGSYIEGIGASDIFWTTAKKLKEDELSDIIAQPTGFYIIKLKSLIPVDEKKFNEEKAGFTENLLQQKKQEHFAAFIQELKAKAQKF